MAVKHKVVECRDPSTHNRLNVILRALESINSDNGLSRTDIAKICEHIVSSLGTVTMPKAPEDYKNFMTDIEHVKEILAKACSSNEVVTATLKALYSGISDPEKQPSPAMSVVLQFIDAKTIPTAVKWILNSGYTDQSLEQALLTLCLWLSKWIYTPNLGVLVLNFMRGLETEQHYDILIEVTRSYIEKFFKLCVLSASRKSVGPVVIYILERMQHSPEAFHKIIHHTDKVLSSLAKENTDSSQYYLHKFVNLFMALMDHFPDYPDLYDPLKLRLDLYEPTKNYKALNCRSWLNTNNSTVTVVQLCGKVGLNNLGNTCYMNSVLQALFMTKLFRNSILTSSRDATPLFSKLQSLFALLQFSQRCSLSPNDILNLARPPGFQQGHQHDSSEFLGYLLDVLHEQEKSIYSNTAQVDGIPPAGTSSHHGSENTVVQQSFGGRAVTLSRCIDCGSHSERADSFRELQLSIPTNCTNHSVQTLLDFYLQPEQLCGDNQYHCDNCQRLTDGERVSKIVELPAQLILTLKHFRYDPASQQRTKLLLRVNLDPYIVLENVQYTLYAAVIHCGSSVDSGHYYTYARDEADWYKFNDCVVFKTKAEELCRLHPPETPYMLFYSRENTIEPAPVQKSELSQRLQGVLLRDNAEFEAEKKRRQMIVSTPRPPGGSGDPPPPGCGDGGFLDSTHNRFVC